MMLGTLVVVATLVTQVICLPEAPRLTIQATCDNEIKLYADGKLVTANNHWPTTSTATVSGQTEVIAIECLDKGGIAGILASVSNGAVTDKSWKCSPRIVPGWASKDFNDDGWTQAYEIGNNGMQPWLKRPHISGTAKWIWTAADTYHGGHKHVYCRLTLRSAPRLTIQATCDNRMKLYADGQLVATNNNWLTTSTATVSGQTEVIAIECVDLHVVGGILASVSNRAVTDRSWKCSSRNIPGWTSKDFNDNGWTNAYEIGTNGMRPWGMRPGINSTAKWIWTAANTYHGQHKHVYCRLDLHPEPQLTIQATCDNRMKLYADGRLVATDNDWRKTTSVSVSGQTKVIAIECVDVGVVGGILASVSNGVTSDSSWRCSHVPVRGWTSVGFDHSRWRHAYSIGMNGMAPWRSRSGIRRDAVWIWSQRNMWRGGHKRVYCRKAL